VPLSHIGCSLFLSCFIILASSRLQNDVSGVGSTTENVADSSSKKKKKHRTKDSVTVSRIVNGILFAKKICCSIGMQSFVVVDSYVGVCCGRVIIQNFALFLRLITQYL